MDRKQALDRLRNSQPLDVLIIGGGATGVGIAVDASTRGYSVGLLERADFGQGASTRSTKLIHGGVRYLQQHNLSLVFESLHERGLLKQNAPHLVHELPFVVPAYSKWEKFYYGFGMKIYDALAGRRRMGKSRRLSVDETLARVPTLQTKHLHGGTLYFDGQFDDARLLLSLAHTAGFHGAALVNYARVDAIEHDADKIVRGVNFTDLETGAIESIAAKCVINATGPFSDSIRRLDDPAAPSMIAPSQGAHIVLDRSFLPGDSAIIVPHTSDGRVMFAIPWLDHTLLGTTDTALPAAVADPSPMEQEINFILETAGQYLQKRPTKSDILSTFAGIRPLVRNTDRKQTSAISRDFLIRVSSSRLVSIAGGKWTTYRRMAEKCVDRAAEVAELPQRVCITKSLPIHVAEPEKRKMDLPEYTAWTAKNEMARSVEDVLARRMRLLLLDARKAIEASPQVAGILANELGKDSEWQKNQIEVFGKLARQFLPSRVLDI